MAEQRRTRKKILKIRRRGAERWNRAKIFEIRWSDGMVDQVKVHSPTGLMGQNGPGCRWVRVPVPVPSPVPLFSLARCQSDLKYIVCSRCNRANLLYTCVVVYLYVENVDAVFDVFLSV